MCIRHQREKLWAETCFGGVRPYQRSLDGCFDVNEPKKTLSRHDKELGHEE